MPDYAPYERAVPFQLSMGLVPLDLRDWIEIDEKFTAELAEKERLLRERHQEVFAVLPVATAGSAEVLTLLADHVTTRFPDYYRRCGDRLDNLVSGHSWDTTDPSMHPLDLAGRLVQEDLCLMRRDATTGEYLLVGASVCFPTRWHLASKMGKSLRVIHDPVPGYDTQLSSSMDRFFDRLKVERSVSRLNWGVVDDPTLFQPTGHGRQAVNAHITARSAGDAMWVRMERQTLRRLPDTGDILFTIRIHIHPLHLLTTRPERAAAMAAAMRALPPPMLQYKSLPPFLDALLAWLDRLPTSTAREPQQINVMGRVPDCC